MLSNCCQFGEGWAKPSEIDKLGLSRALSLGAARALRMLQVRVDEELMLDGNFNYLPKKFKNSSTLVNADNLVPIVSAASIYAKVTRDKYMYDLAKKYPAYNFEAHVGYGTKAHMLAIKSSGAIKYVHRFSFTPIADLAGV
jgi:ribonuclease HII